MTQPLAVGYDLLRQRVTTTPHHNGLTFEDGRQWTFALLDEEVRALADRLEPTVAPGDAVLIYAPNSPELVVAMFAIWRLGAVPLLLNHLYPADDLRRACAEVAPAAVIASPSAKGHSDLADVGAVLGDHRPQGMGEVSLVAPGIGRSGIFDPDALAVLLTGGTTGTSKHVVISREGTVQRIEAQREGQLRSGRSSGPRTDPAVRPERYNLICVPLYHIAGLKSLLFAWSHDRNVVLMSKFEPNHYANLVGRYGVDNLFLLPTMLYDLAHSDVPADALAGAKYVITGGQRLGEDVRAAFSTKFNVPILNHYGSTEVGAVAGWSRSDLADGTWRPDAVGRVYPGMAVRILDQDGNPADVGEIVVRSLAASQYVGASTDEALVDSGGWIRTGDIGRLDDDGLLYLSGRSKELIKVGGFQVWPGEIERALRQHRLVRDVAVVGVGDDRLGEVPVAFVVPTDDEGDDAVLAAELAEHCRANLAPYKVPRRFVPLAQLPRLDTGKVAAAELTRLATNAH